MPINTCIPPEIASSLKRQFRSKTELGEGELKTKIQDILNKKYGSDLTADQSAKLVDMSDEFMTAKTALGDNLGSVAYEKQMTEYFLAQNNIDRFLKELAPSGNLAIASGTIGRGSMLASIKSPLLNIGSNVENSITEMLIRRLSSGQFTKSNSDLAKNYFQMANRIYNKTGVDISRMTDIGDLGVGGQRVLGKDTVSAVGSGPVRKLGRWVEDIVFKNLMGKPDSLTANFNFVDSVSLNATKYAKNDASKARTFMEDAMLITPKTEEGTIIRAQAVIDAQVSTYTQRTWASAMSEGIRNQLNKNTGALRLGDWLMPFVKTPANIVAIGVDYAGLGAFKATYKLASGIKNGTLNDPGVLRDLISDSVRAGVGMTTAFIISRNISEENFVGAYDPKRKQIEQLKNSNYNAIKIGDKWISVEWLGPLAIPVTAMMYAKKGNSYITGAAIQATQIPGISVLKDIYKGTDITNDTNISEVAKSTGKSTMDAIASRLVPGIVTDIGKAMDSNQRDTKGDVLGTIKSKLPILRETLPEKKTVLGDTMKNESPLTSILFGARVKTDVSTPEIKEVDRVTTALGKGSTFTDWSKSTTKELVQFKAKVGEAKFNEAKGKYGAELKVQLQNLFKNPMYKAMTTENQLKAINTQDAQAQEKIFRQYGFKYIQEKNPKQPKL